MADNLERVLPPLATLVAFEAAFRHRNFTRAADELFQSQTTVSRRVRELEADLGVSLFERQRYDATPTPHAEVLASSVRLALSELGTTAERIRRDGSGTNSMTVLSSLALTSAMVIPAVTELQQDHPDLDIRVLSACEPIETTREQFDIAIQYGPRSSKRFEVEFIAEDTVFPVCSPEFAAALSEPLTLEELARLPLLDVTYEDPTWMTWTDFFASFSANALFLGAKLTVSSYRVSLDAARNGDGVALGWGRSVDPLIDAGTLVEIPGHRPGEVSSINTYRPPGTVKPDVGRLVDLLKQRADV